MAIRAVNIHEARTHFSRLVDRAVAGEPFIIAKSGKPSVKVEALAAPTTGPSRRIGFLAGHISVPDDFDRMGQAEIERMFGVDK